MTEQLGFSGLRIISVRVRNFRSLRNVETTLEQLTALIGENNSGKSSFIEAIFSAFGPGRTAFSEADIFPGPEEKRLSKERRIMVDLLLRPLNDQGTIEDSFPAGSLWLETWGNSVYQDANDCDFLALRSSFGWSEDRGEYGIERRFLKDWIKGTESENRPTAKQLATINIHLLAAQRDVAKEQQQQKSFWGRLVGDLGLPPELSTSIEAELFAVGGRVVEGSGVLAHFKKTLGGLSDLLGSPREAIDIRAVPQKIEDLQQSIDAYFSTQGARAFPLAHHGMGTRSLATLMAFEAWTTWFHRNQKRKAMHIFLELEEPEAHLHPHAQRTLAKRLSESPAQGVLTSHSPTIVSGIPLSSLRVFRKVGPETRVSAVPSFDKETVGKIERRILRSRGDILFSRVMIIFEGETEELSLPIFALSYWKCEPDSLGISLVSADGSGNILPFVQFAQGVNIPWVVFSDGDRAGQDTVNSICSKVSAEKPDAHHQNIFVIPGQTNYEDFLCQDYGVEIVYSIDELEEMEGYIEKDYIRKHHGQKKKGNKDPPEFRDYQSEGGFQRAVLDYLLENKIKVAQHVAKAIVALPEPRNIPMKIRQLFKRVDELLTLFPKVKEDDHAIKPD